MSIHTPAEEELFTWLLANHRLVSTFLLVSPYDRDAVLPKGYRVDLEMYFESPYALIPIRDPLYFSVVRAGTRAWEPEKSYEITKFEKWVTRRWENLTFWNLSFGHIKRVREGYEKLHSG
jgi:hypothetical protein